MSQPDPHPLSTEERQRRGFCICPNRVRRDPQPQGLRCAVHPDERELPEAQRLAASLLFFDDRRQRFVSWPDAVEAMRQDWPAGPDKPGLTLFTWVNLIRLLEALHDPLASPAPQLTEAQADALIAWSGESIPPVERRRLITVARGGLTESICTLFRMAARAGYQAATAP